MSNVQGVYPHLTCSTHLWTVDKAAASGSASPRLCSLGRTREKSACRDTVYTQLYKVANNRTSKWQNAHRPEKNVGELILRLVLQPSFFHGNKDVAVFRFAFEQLLVSWNEQEVILILWRFCCLKANTHNWVLSQRNMSKVTIVTKFWNSLKNKQRSKKFKVEVYITTSSVFYLEIGEGPDKMASDIISRKQKLWNFPKL